LLENFLEEPTSSDQCSFFGFVVTIHTDVDAQVAYSFMGFGTFEQFLMAIASGYHELEIGR